MQMSVLWLSILVAALVAGPVSGETKIRVGHFPNITHAQGVIAHALSRQGKGWFEQRLGEETKVEWFVYNAGPSAMEAIFAKSIDLTYVGSGPALNAYTKSNGKEIRLIAGAANGFTVWGPSFGFHRSAPEAPPCRARLTSLTRSVQ
jgi:NitT/TauT family transport system substrate-binding protein